MVRPIMAFKISKIYSVDNFIGRLLSLLLKASFLIIFK